MTQTTRGSFVQVIARTVSLKFPSSRQKVKGPTLPQEARQGWGTRETSFRKENRSWLRFFTHDSDALLQNVDGDIRFFFCHHQGWT